MAQEQLTLISETIHLPSNNVASFTARGLSFDPQASEKDLLDIGKRLFAVRGYVKWSLGSLFAEMLKKRGVPQGNGATAKQDTGWVSEFCDAHQLDPKERREMLGVVLFYKDCKDTPCLSFEHHREAMWGAANGQPGEVDRACAFLKVAYEGGLSVTQLRAIIRGDQRTEQKEEKQLELAALSWVYDMRRYVKKEIDAMATYTPERAALILDDLGKETLTYIDNLRVIAKGLTNV